MINVVCLLFIHLPVFTYPFQFSFNHYWGNFKKLHFIARKYMVTRRTPRFEQILIDEVYFLVKNDAPCKWINTVFMCGACDVWFAKEEKNPFLQECTWTTPCNFSSPLKVYSNQHNATTTTFNTSCRSRFNVCRFSKGSSNFKFLKRTKSSHIVPYELHQCGFLI